MLEISFEIRSDEPFARTLYFTDQLARPLDLSTYAAKIEVYTLDQSELLATLSTANGRITIGEYGEITMTIPQTSDSAWPWPVGKGDLVLTSGTGTVYRPVFITFNKIFGWTQP